MYINIYYLIVDFESKILNFFLSTWKTIKKKRISGAFFFSFLNAMGNIIWNEFYFLSLYGMNNVHEYRKLQFFRHNWLRSVCLFPFQHFLHIQKYHQRFTKRRTFNNNVRLEQDFKDSKQMLLNHNHQRLYFDVYDSEIINLENGWNNKSKNRIKLLTNLSTKVTTAMRKASFSGLKWFYLTKVYVVMYEGR